MKQSVLKNIRKMSRPEETSYSTKKQRWEINGKTNLTNELELIPRYKIDKNFPKTVPIMSFKPDDVDETLNDLRKRAKLS